MQTRREFALGALAAFAFFKSLPGKEVFASAIRPLAGHWLGELDALSRAAQSQARQGAGNGGSGGDATGGASRTMAARKPIHGP